MKSVDSVTVEYLCSLKRTILPLCDCIALEIVAICSPTFTNRALLMGDNGLSEIRKLASFMSYDPILHYGLYRE